jgi:dihydroorotase
VCESERLPVARLLRGLSKANHFCVPDDTRACLKWSIQLKYGGMGDLWIKNVRVIDPAVGRDEVASLIIRRGVIQPHGSPVAGLREIDGDGLIAAPGFWDVHVHFRDPGNSLAETQLSGAMAAASGGFTHVVTMPNTVPAVDSPEQLRRQIDELLPVRILPSACISAQRGGYKLANLTGLINAGAVALTDDGAMLADDDLMREAMRQANALNSLIMEHAVMPSLANRGIIRDCPLAHRYNLPIFPPEAEIEAVRRDIALCRETGCRLHIQHISCGESVELIRRARREGLAVTGEASPHHIAIAAEEITTDNGNFRMNPPLGNHKDVRAIRDGILDGTITVLATDHAPHTVETKSYGFLNAAFGVIGLETAIGVSWKIMVEQERMDISRWVECWSTAPARLLNQPVPSLVAGRRADLVLIDPQSEWSVNPDEFKSLSRNTPFGGWRLKARALLTICDGRQTHCALRNTGRTRS